MNQEQHIALEMSTIKMAHTDRERENAPIKQHQGKTSSIKAQ
jgi:hypothetical protein